MPSTPVSRFTLATLVLLLAACSERTPLEPERDSAPQPDLDAVPLVEGDVVVSATFSEAVPFNSFVLYCGGVEQTPCTARGLAVPPTVQVRWGEPTVGGVQSGLGFEAAEPTIEPNREFLIGGLTHFNFPVFDGARAVTLTFDLAIDGEDGFAASFPVRFDVDETVNQAPCAYSTDGPPCADRISWSLPEPTAIEAGGTVYALNIKGFRESASSSSPPVDGFVSDEGQETTAYLFAELVDVTAQSHAIDDAYDFEVGQPLTVSAPGVLANDVDVDSAFLAVPPEHGTVEFESDGGFVYTPDDDSTRADALVYFGRVANGELSLAAVTLSPVDRTPPVISPPEDIVAEATGPAGVRVSWDAPAAEDAIDGTVPVTCAPDSGSEFPLGDTVVECTASDAAGNEAIASFTVTVEDTTPPELFLPGDLELYSVDADGVHATYEAAAEDLVDGAVPVSCSPDSGDLFPIGPTTVECSAEDAAGNTAADAFTVTVIAAAELFDRLVDLSTGVGPGRSLSSIASNARASALRGSTTAACGQLGAYLRALDAGNGRSIAPGPAADLREIATRIRELLSC